MLNEKLSFFSFVLLITRSGYSPKSNFAAFSSSDGRFCLHFHFMSPIRVYGFVFHSLLQRQIHFAAYVFCTVFIVAITCSLFCFWVTAKVNPFFSSSVGLEWVLPYFHFTLFSISLQTCPLFLLLLLSVLNCALKSMTALFQADQLSLSFLRSLWMNRTLSTAFIIASLSIEETPKSLFITIGFFKIFFFVWFSCKKLTNFFFSLLFCNHSGSALVIRPFGQHSRFCNSDRPFAIFAPSATHTLESWHRLLQWRKHNRPPAKHCNKCVLSRPTSVNRASQPSTTNVRTTKATRWLRPNRPLPTSPAIRPAALLPASRRPIHPPRLLVTSTKTRTTSTFTIRRTIVSTAKVNRTRSLRLRSACNILSPTRRLRQFHRAPAALQVVVTLRLTVNRLRIVWNGNRFRHLTGNIFTKIWTCTVIVRPLLLPPRRHRNRVNSIWCSCTKCTCINKHNSSWPVSNGCWPRPLLQHRTLRLSLRPNLFPCLACSSLAT